ncbi:hypothetical protein BD289DRAFT_118658 [Coniella lustricola]|uniref:Uncharacterized protein n=1 Tax=Coniella lustricola TaxID=2025994 RepID=A0A2T3AG11_9PEZI|nr:hypothetical protein BD289DRAFT_118658 [Coniella lustricola]
MGLYSSRICMPCKVMSKLPGPTSTSKVVTNPLLMRLYSRVQALPRAGRSRRLRLQVGSFSRSPFQMSTVDSDSATREVSIHAGPKTDVEARPSMDCVLLSWCPGFARRDECTDQTALFDWLIRGAYPKSAAYLLADKPGFYHEPQLNRTVISLPSRISITTAFLMST